VTWLLATALAAGIPTESAMHRGTVAVDTVQWASTWRSQARCVELAAPFDPPAPYTIEARKGRPWLCRPDHVAWSLRYERPFPSDELDLPLLAHQLQRIEVSGAHFDSDDGAVTKHLRVWSGPGITRRDRKQLDRSLPRSHATTRIYVEPTPGTSLQGRLRPSGARSGAVYGALAAFVTLGATLAGAYRLLERGARRERFERWLQDGGAVPADERQGDAG